MSKMRIAVAIASLPALLAGCRVGSLLESDGYDGYSCWTCEETDVYETVYEYDDGYYIDDYYYDWGWPDTSWSDTLSYEDEYAWYDDYGDDYYYDDYYDDYDYYEYDYFESGDFFDDLADDFGDGGW